MRDRNFYSLHCAFTIFTLVSMVFFIHTSVDAQVKNTLKKSQSDIKHFGSSQQPDTIENANDSLKNRDKEFTDRLKASASKHYVFRQLTGLVLRKDALSTSGKVIKEFETGEKYNKYSNKEISEIRIIRMKCFGQSVYDTLSKPSTIVEKFGNSLHVNTVNSVIENNLLFSEGDLLKPVDFAETEQILRELPFIEDANIIIQTLADTNKVRAIIITKDKWTMALGVQASHLGKINTRLSERNFAGVGLGALGYLFYDNTKPDKWGYMGEIRVPNISGSFISGDFWFREGLGYNTYYMNLNRDFYASKAKFAGGVKFMFSKEPYRIFYLDSIVPIDYDLKDYWIGRSFRVSRSSSLTAPYNLTFAAKYRAVTYSQSPTTSITENPYFHSTKQYLFSIGLTNQNLYQSNLIYEFGSTEDIPIGFKVQFASGIEESQYQRRFLVNGEMSAAEITPLGYLYLSVRAGGYLAEGPKLEQASINIRSTYITNLFSIGRSDVRQFVRYDFTRGISRFDGEKEYIALRNSYGIRGLTSNQLIGTTRLMFNFETVVFSPLYVYGFRFAYFLFCDLGTVGSSDDLVYMNPIYSGFGLGLRVKNESLIFPTFLFRLGYYPKLPINADVANFLISTENRRSFEQFRVKEPEVLPFE